MTTYEYNQLQNMLTDIQNRKLEYLSCKYKEGYETAILKMKSMIHSFHNSHKTEDVEPVRHGYWIRKGPYQYCCSECEGAFTWFGNSKYCPNVVQRWGNNQYDLQRILCFIS